MWATNEFFNRTRVAGHLDEIEGTVANMFEVFERGSWLNRLVRCSARPTGASADSSGSGLLFAQARYSFRKGLSATHL